MMELEELKQKWETLDRELTHREIYDKKILTELIRTRTDTLCDKLRKGAIYSLVVTLGIALVLVPLLRMKGIYGHEATFWMLEAVCVLGLAMAAVRLVILSRFDPLSDPGLQLGNLVRYKRWRVYEMAIGAPLAIFAIVAALALDGVGSPLGVAGLVLGVVLGLASGWIGWKRHRITVQETERNLTELKEFEYVPGK